MKLELTQFTTGCIYKTRTYTGPAAAGIESILLTRPVQKIRLDGDLTVFISRYASGRIYRVWTVER